MKSLIFSKASTRHSREGGSPPLRRTDRVRNKPWWIPAFAGMTFIVASLTLSLQAQDPVNFLLITADDLNYSSVGVFGSPVDDITPNLDGLAAEGMRFEYGHVTIAVCQPSRQVMMTGRYPHNNGAPGFQAVRADVPILQESLNQAGFLNGSIGKTRHLNPRQRYHWDMGPDESSPDSGIWMHHLGQGRDIDLYEQYMRQFLQKVKSEDKPFWLMANTHDPHRPYFGTGGADHDYPNSRVYTEDEVDVPGFLPDLPDIRKEITQYYNSVKRCDDIIGRILHVLEDEGFKNNTLVMFTTDNGMSFPFAKANAYLNSTKAAWIVRWPGEVTPGIVDTTHFVSTIDYMPTVLEVAGLPMVEGMNGNSMLPVLRGKQQGWRTHVFTEFNMPSNGRQLTMRTVQNKDFGYIYNPFTGEVQVYMESMFGLTWNAMVQASSGDPDLADRVDLFENRVLEELYNFRVDPDALVNLIDEAEHQEVLEELRQIMANEMYMTDDPELEEFENRYGITGVDIVNGCMTQGDANYNPQANRHDHTMCAVVGTDPKIHSVPIPRLEKKPWGFLLPEQFANEFVSIKHINGKQVPFTRDGAKIIFSSNESLPGIYIIKLGSTVLKFIIN